MPQLTKVSLMKARRAFRALKGIIRLQALIRGHLVRRQAVVTLCCMYGIVKLQALGRGQSVRKSDVGFEIQEKCILLKFQVIFSESDLSVHYHLFVMFFILFLKFLGLVHGWSWNMKLNL
jgi:hypothetical protein